MVNAMATQQDDENDRWWTTIKYWLSIFLLLASLGLMGWIFVLESIH